NIGGQTPVDVYTGFEGGEVPKANYTGFGGNDSTTGTFAGAGANNPQPIEDAPPFDGDPFVPKTAPPTASSSTGGGSVTSVANGRGGKRGPAINVANSGELLALLDGAASGPDGKVNLSPGTGSRKSPNGFKPAVRVKPDRDSLTTRATTSPAARHPLH
ncbi:MAG: hypothetical protein ABI540_01920, partial [Spartobacteria bacterium]